MQCRHVLYFSGTSVTPHSVHVYAPDSSVTSRVGRSYSLSIKAHTPCRDECLRRDRIGTSFCVDSACSISSSRSCFLSRSADGYFVSSSSGHTPLTHLKLYRIQTFNINTRGEPNQLDIRYRSLNPNNEQHTNEQHPGHQDRKATPHPCLVPSRHTYYSLLHTTVLGAVTYQ